MRAISGSLARRRVGLVGVAAITLVIVLYSDGGWMRVSHAQPSGWTSCYPPPGSNPWNQYWGDYWMNAGWFISPSINPTAGTATQVCGSTSITSWNNPNIICGGNGEAGLDIVIIYTAEDLAAGFGGDTYIQYDHGADQPNDLHWTSDAGAKQWSVDQYPADGYVSWQQSIYWYGVISGRQMLEQFASAMSYGSSCTSDSYQESVWMSS